jgi:hypothetical protein
MKKIFLLSVIVFIVSGVSVFAQTGEFSSSRLSNLSSTLKRQTVDLADRVYRDYKSRSSHNRSDTDLLFVTQQLDASAYLFQEMIRDDRRADELRDAAGILDSLARRAPSYGANFAWRDVQRTIDDIQRELGGTGGGSGGGYPGPGNGDNYIGKVTWRGTVDQVIQIDILNRALGVRTISGQDYGNGTFNFTSALPQNKQVQVYVIKKKGRGDVRVLQQPSRNNNGGAVIEVRDTDPGSKEYELEIYWK